MVTSVFPGLVRNTFYCPTYLGEIEANLLAAKPKGQRALIIFSCDQFYSLNQLPGLGNIYQCRLLITS